MRRVISYCILIFCLEFVASFPYPEEYLEAYQSNNPTLGEGVPRQNGPSNPAYQEFINRDTNTVLQPTRYNNIRYETRPSFDRPVQYSHVEYPSNINTATPSAIQDMINRETIAKQRQNYENLIRSQQQIHEQFANQMRVQNLPQIQPQYPSREPLLNTVSEPYVNVVSPNNPYQQNVGNDNNISPAVPQYYHVQQQLPLYSPTQRPFAENNVQSGQNFPTQIEINHDVPTSPLNRQFQQSYNQWPNKQISNAPGYDLHNLFAKHPYIKDLLSTTTQRKRYMVIHPNGTVEHVDKLEPVAERHPNYLLVNAGSLPQNYGHWPGHYPQPQAPPATSPATSTSPNSNYYANPYQPIAPTPNSQLNPEPSSIYTAPEAYPPQLAAPAPTNPQAPAAPVAPETSTPISATQVLAPQPTFPAPQPTIPAPTSAQVEPEVAPTPATPAKSETSAPTDSTKPTVPSNSALAPKPAVPATPDGTSPPDLPKAADPAIQATPASPGPKVTPTPSKTATLPVTHLKPAVPANPDTKSKLNVPETSAVPSKTSEPAKAHRLTAKTTPPKLNSSAQPTVQATTSTPSEQTTNIKQSVPVTDAEKTASEQPKPDPANITNPDSLKSLTTPAKPDNVTTPTLTKPAPTTSTTSDKRAGYTTPRSLAKPVVSTTSKTPSKPADSKAPTSPASHATSTTPAKPADSTTSTSPSKRADSTAPTSPVSPVTSTTPAKPVSSETPVTPAKQTTPKTTTPDKPAASKTPAKLNGPTTSTTPAKPADSTASTSPASPVTSTTPAKPVSSETPVTPVKQTTSKTTTPDKPAASKTPAKPNGPKTSTTPAKPHSSGTPTPPASPKKTTSLPQASTTPSTAVGKANSPSNKTSAIVKTTASAKEIAEPNNDTSIAEKLNPLGVDFSKVKSTSKPVMWFRTSDLDVMNKLTADDEFNVIYFIQVPPQPKIEKDIIKTVFPNGTIVEEITETIWNNEEDEEPRVTKTVKVLNQKN